MDDSKSRADLMSHGPMRRQTRMKFPTEEELYGYHYECHGEAKAEAFLFIYTGIAHLVDAVQLIDGSLLSTGTESEVRARLPYLREQLRSWTRWQPHQWFEIEELEDFVTWLAEQWRRWQAVSDEMAIEMDVRQENKVIPIRASATLMEMRTETLRRSQAALAEFAAELWMATNGDIDITVRLDSQDSGSVWRQT